MSLKELDKPCVYVHSWCWYDPFYVMWIFLNVVKRMLPLNTMELCVHAEVNGGFWHVADAHFSPQTSHFFSYLLFCFTVSAQFSPSGSLALSPCLSHASFFTQKSPTVTTVVSKQRRDSRRLTSALLVHRWDTNIYPYRVHLSSEGPWLGLAWLECPWKTNQTRFRFVSFPSLKPTWRHTCQHTEPSALQST